MHTRTSVAVLTVLVSLSVLAPVARAEDPPPPVLHWEELLPTMPLQYQPNSADECVSGRTSCVDTVIRKMTQRFNPLASSCAHDAIFALAYLRTTQAYRSAVSDPSFFMDNGFVNHEDAVFAQMYFDAFDAFHSGHLDDTAPAWRIAFQSAAREELPAAGNLVLGMNAHIQNDLPFTLAAIGLVRPDGGSRKPDHDRVNDILNRVPGPLTREIARYFDQSIDDTSMPTYVDDLVNFQSVESWREIAWRNAERLVSARDAAARAGVAAIREQEKKRVRKEI